MTDLCGTLFLIDDEIRACLAPPISGGRQCEEHAASKDGELYRDIREAALRESGGRVPRNLSHDYRGIYRVRAVPQCHPRPHRQGEPHA